ncbi:hypothetical protein HYZ99_05135 [Candidatus Peregrinibacteria bacterium]|nr:hypothetical protein [Candidatus Peregrinibacteria bacterium]
MFITDADDKARLLTARYLIEQSGRENIFQGLPDEPSVFQVRGRLAEAISTPPRLGELQAIGEVSQVHALEGARDDLRRGAYDPNEKHRALYLEALAPLEAFAAQQLKQLTAKKRAELADVTSSKGQRRPCC